MNLIEHLKTIPDFRYQPRYPLWLILLVIIMGAVNGCTSYRALEDFVSRHQTALLELLGLDFKRLPSFSTLRRIMVRLNFHHLCTVFNAWAQETFPPQPGEQIPADGKGIKVSVRNQYNSEQDFINIVSAFSIQQGLVIGLAPFQNGQSSEIATLQALLAGLQLNGVCFSMDALHTQKND
jgi:hypothetical protein